MQITFNALCLACRSGLIAAATQYAAGNLTKQQFIAIFLYLLLRFHAVASLLGALHASGDDASAVADWINAQGTQASTALLAGDGEPAGGRDGSYFVDTGEGDIAGTLYQQQDGEWIRLTNVNVSPSTVGATSDIGEDVETLISAQDRNVAEAALDSQRQYVSGFAGAIGDSLGGEPETGLFDYRASLYTIRLRATANEAWADALPDGTEITWNLGDAEHHCPDCPANAAASPFTADTLPSYPGDGDTACGIGCKCYLTTEEQDSFTHYLPADDDETKARRETHMNKIDCIKSVAVKSATAAGNTLCCVPSVMGVLDYYDDVIMPGAFVKALPKFLRRGFNPMSHGWDWESLVGYPTVAYEKNNQLYSEFVFHTDPQSQAALTKCRERLDAGMEVGLSVGFSMQPGQYEYFNTGAELLAWAKKSGYDMKLLDVKGITAHAQPCSAIKEIDELMEYSLTPVPANVQAMAVAVKSLMDKGKQVTPSVLRSRKDSAMPGTVNVLRLRTICGARGLSFASQDTAWSASAAMKRVKEFADATDAPNSAFAKAFTVVSGPNDEFGSYHLPFADVKDGKLVAVWGAIKAIAGALEGARGGVELSDSDRTAAKRFVEVYYAKAAKDFDDDTIKVPWSDDDSTDKSIPKWKGQYLGNWVEYEMAMSAIPQASYALHSEVGDYMLGRGQYKDMGPDDCTDCLGGSFDEHKDLCMSLASALKSGDGAETSDEAALSLERHMLSTISTIGLGSGLAWDKHANVAVNAARMMTDRARERSEVRSTTRRKLSRSDCVILRAMCDDLTAQIAEIEDILAKTAPTPGEDPETQELLDECLRVQAETALLAV